MQCIGCPATLSDNMAIDGFWQSFLQTYNLHCVIVRGAMYLMCDIFLKKKTNPVSSNISGAV